MEILVDGGQLADLLDKLLIIDVITRLSVIC